MSQKSSKIITPPILKGEGLPEYLKITPEQINIHIPQLIKDLKSLLNQLENSFEEKISQNKEITWDEVMLPLHNLGENLRWSWGVITHLNGVCNSAELRKAYTSQQSGVVRFINQLGQSQVIHKTLFELRNNSPDKLNEIEKRILDSELLSMHHRGVALSGKIKNEFNTDSERLAELSTRFSNNVLDATNEWSLLLTLSSEINGLPTRALEILAKAAADAGDINPDNGQMPTPKEGPWRLGLDLPRYIPFMTHATNRSLREKVYKAYMSRASSGKLNNQLLIEEILTLRSKQASRLGYANWAELSLANKMANEVESVEQLLEELRAAAMPTAQKELNRMKEFATNNNKEEAHDFSPWDINFWAEKLRKEELELDKESLRPWFPLPQVLDGLFSLCNRLFDIYIKEADGEAPTWHKDVRFFKVLDKEGHHIASFYLDPYSRPKSKRGGAWMDECLIRSKNKKGETTLPIAYLVCNQTQPVDEKPSLMSFEEVETLFHEFGHGLQHMLTTIDYPQAAGINNVEWDAVELPSQFMENWCHDKKTLTGIAKHWETGEELPEEEFIKLQRDRTFNSGLATLRQINLALTDIRLHSQWNRDMNLTPDQLRREISTFTTVVPPIPEDQFLCSFSHIFAGGYSAGYYSYKWAEVLSADAYSAFEEVGLNEEGKIKAMGNKFRETILSLGGSDSPASIFELFRGRPPKTDALIRHSGLGISN